VLTRRVMGAALSVVACRLNVGNLSDTGHSAEPAPTAAMADYVDASIMWSHDRCRAPTTDLERQAPILSSTCPPEQK
ncbi:MAG: hypothetical protein Q8N23_14085, partial [Archangium sp.]|nr:hypothetical protein [Archangium sp.]